MCRCGEIGSRLYFKMNWTSREFNKQPLPDINHINPRQGTHLGLASEESTACNVVEILMEMGRCTCDSFDSLLRAVCLPQLYTMKTQPKSNPVERVYGTELAILEKGKASQPFK
ncbi:hypothetical protein Pelo_2681 [Pelomyxa schiedti]|nr:hypothetical protein Pelo_2681 [Pelomyxa schiedti]